MKVPSNFFKYTHPAITFVIVFGLFYCVALMAYLPKFLTIGSHLGPLGTALENYATNNQEYTRRVFHIIMAVHAAEALLALALALFWRQLTIGTSLKWTFSVFINGYFSLRYLFWPQLTSNHQTTKADPKDSQKAKRSRPAKGKRFY
ncbi:hypothetical protein TCAL_17095 [Tigriopus californicus]|uniref:Uncharacterized protein n=1 Tax=Tigriopus californicus TaxID=6832 RepID=A0A553PQZ2_TIGCA|nr:uncharacterized protein LOC131881800 [Tigriopus californicus]TRY80096.1 hypothetical protein TCAL_17095 [Tigriopus californicus]